MHRSNLVFGIMLVLIGLLTGAKAQAQWVAQGANYVQNSEIKTVSGTGHYNILVGTQWGSVNSYADPTGGGYCDCLVTIAFPWKWIGNISQITDLYATPTGDFVGDGPYPAPQGGRFFESEVDTYGVKDTINIFDLPGPYNVTKGGMQQAFHPAPPSNIISVAGQVHSIAMLPFGPWSIGASAQSSIYW